MRNRWYTPQIGRFITKDPILQLQLLYKSSLFPTYSLSLKLNFSTFAMVPLFLNTPHRLHPYAYVQNNPVNYRDPSGLGDCRIICEGASRIVCYGVITWLSTQRCEVFV
jgi:hypothetical protein